jgi:hypothetical protein
MRCFKRTHLFVHAPVRLVKLLIFFALVNLQVQAVFAEQTTLMMPLHKVFPARFNDSASSNNDSRVDTASAGSDVPDATDTAAVPPISVAESNVLQAPLPLKDSKPADQPKKLKGRVVVPANPCRGVNNSSTPFAPEGTLRRALPAPLDPVFPSTEYVGIASQLQIGIPDQDPMFPLEKAIYKSCPFLAKNRIKIYGWANPGVDYSTSHKSNIPLSYFVVPNHIEMDQLVFRAERVPDTVQNEHMDWGFRTTWLYGIDYRWTTSQGWYPASNELLKHNQVYGLDPVELYTCLYIPKIADGMILKFGRYISPPDIEAQLAPDNYLWTHSLMFDYDCYTQTGLLASIKLNESWMVQSGICAGADTAPWAKGAIPTGSLLLRWQARNNKDMLYGGCNSINNGQYRLYGEKDNLQQFNLTWFHRFNRRFHVCTEGYFLYTFNALQGGTVNNGPPRPVNLLTGPGKILPGFSEAWGIVSYWNTKITDRDYITVRPVDILMDPRGWRSGFPGYYASWTVGWIHHFSDLLTIRPEIRYERALSHSSPWDNGLRRYQFTIGADLIQRF